ncbi:MAG TPA: hypothetical protein VGP36_03305 [Mycobacteriales bacterium]|nr:hypothetical protein [Mycobacteriales bacterium]
MRTALRFGRVLAGLAGVTALGLGLMAGSPAAAAPAHQHPVATARPSAGQLAAMKAATTRFHNIATAEDASYGLLHDQAGITCIAMPGEGGMGVHFVNGDLVGTPTVDLRHPEALVYAPDRDGTLRLAALEFIVDKAAWDAHHRARPQLFRNAPFDLTTAPNRYGLAPFYSQHVWLYQPNPAGTLTMWNPRVHCPSS